MQFNPKLWVGAVGRCYGRRHSAHDAAQSGRPTNSLNRSRRRQIRPTPDASKVSQRQWSTRTSRQRSPAACTSVSGRPSASRELSLVTCVCRAVVHAASASPDLLQIARNIRKEHTQGGQAPTPWEGYVNPCTRQAQPWCLPSFRLFPSHPTRRFNAPHNSPSPSRLSSVPSFRAGHYDAMPGRGPS